MSIASQIHELFHDFDYFINTDVKQDDVNIDDYKKVMSPDVNLRKNTWKDRESSTVSEYKRVMQYNYYPPVIQKELNLEYEIVELEKENDELRGFIDQADRKIEQLKKVCIDKDEWKV